jgi:uncharacterized protein YecT (DUF1311 family)
MAVACSPSGARFRMRIIMLAVVTALIGSMLSAQAEGTSEPDLSLRDMLPLFEKNRCADVRDSAGQLFCGDPELQAAGVQLNAAVQERLSRIADRQMAIEENVEWIKSRNLSCGIFQRQSVANLRLPSVKACLLKQTRERIAILEDPNFDCLADDSTAGMLICSDPALTLADKDLNGHVLALIAKVKEGEVKAALAEYARWIRDRDRKCDLDDKENVPLNELSPPAACLADYIKQKAAEVVAAKGDPKRVFGRTTTSPVPDADAVDLCIAQIHSTNTCHDFLRVSRIIQVDTEVSAEQALVTAEIEMKVLSPFGACSPIASGCTGTCWDVRSGQAKAAPGSRENVPLAHRLKVDKSFAFQKTASGGWRCSTPVLQPIEFGIAIGGL